MSRSPTGRTVTTPDLQPLPPRTVSTFHHADGTVETIDDDKIRRTVDELATGHIEALTLLDGLPRTELRWVVNLLVGRLRDAERALAFSYTGDGVRALEQQRDLRRMIIDAGGPDPWPEME